MSYRYRLWGMNWLPWLGLALGTMGLWVFLKHYDVTAWSELTSLQYKIPVQIGGWLFLWGCLRRGFFKIRFVYYGIWSFVVLSEVGQSVYLHDGQRFILSIILGILLYLTSIWMESRLEEASVNPRLKWYSGRLMSIPHVQAEILSEGEESIPADLRAIDETGAFLLLREESSHQGWSGRSVFTVKLKYKTIEVRVKGRLMSMLEWEQRGFGLQFSFEDLYHQNQYTSLVQQLKGEGLA